MLLILLTFVASEMSRFLLQIGDRGDAEEDESTACG